MKKTALFFSGWLIFLLSHFLIECWAGVVIEELHRDTDGRMNRVIRYYSGEQFRTDHPE